jgi:alpha-amylase/alpha-mannosidase (GH57 family)
MVPLRYVLFLLVAVAALAPAQPKAVPGGVQFAYNGKAERSVALVGDFNGWSKDETPMTRDEAGSWHVMVPLAPGIFQYKFVIDGTEYVTDPANTVSVDNYNRSAHNSVFVLTEGKEILLTSEPPAMKTNPRDEYTLGADKKPVYLNIIWHQHQPLYVNPETDQMTGPWVRTHATKDYYDMAAMLRGYPNIHCTINLTSSLLLQLTGHYVDRLKPFVDTRDNTIDIPGFWKQWKGKTDPWIDLALKPTEEFDRTDKDLLYRNPWNAFGISEVMIERFPEYHALKTKLERAQGKADPFTVQELREIKFWFYVAHFDPDFLTSPVPLPDRSVCDLTDIIEFRKDKKFYLRRPVTEEDCHRMVVEAYKVMAAVVPIHKQLQFRPETRTGQVELITTPYYHPILPLIYDSDLARVCQPGDSLPPRFQFPADAGAQVTKAVKFFTDVFGTPPTGMWPGEGSVAQPILPLLRSRGILWAASDVKVLKRSNPPDQPNTTPYQFPAGEQPIAMVFRDTELSDRIGFKYQNYFGEDAAEDFIRTILTYAPDHNAPDVMITVILDGENAWEWYKKDIDGKDFLNALYRKLSKLQMDKRVITTTTTEYLLGNTGRGIEPHPAGRLPAMKWLWPGSWINANFDTWIGEPEENRAWSYLLTTRMDLQESRIQPPLPYGPAPRPGTPAWYGIKAWESMYAAEGSDWFWWFGTDQQAPGGDRPFDQAFRAHLTNVYKFAKLAKAIIPERTFDPIVVEKNGAASAGAGSGAMARGSRPLHKVLLTCDARALKKPLAIFVAGNHDHLGNWNPNTTHMFDDGTHGDAVAGDGIWSLLVELPTGVDIQYKYTNNGKPGEWTPGEEFPARHRTIHVEETSGSPFVVTDIFGQ